jgi:hypothetical protein
VRSHHWDRLRLVAIFDVAAFHMFYEWGVFGVGIPFFLILTLALGGAKGESVGSVVKKRFARLMVPWIFWALAIAAARVGRMILGARDSNWRWEMLLYGPWDSLWFLPTAFAASVLLAWIRKMAPGHSVGSILLCAVLSAAFVVIPFPEIGRTPFHQWIWSLPALPLAFALGAAIEKHGGPRSARKDAAILCAATIAAYVLVWTLADAEGRDSLVRFGLSIAMLTLVLFIPDAPDRFTALVAPLILGIYVIHDPFWELGLRLLHWERWIAYQVPQVLLLLGICAALTFALRKTPVARFL